MNRRVPFLWSHTDLPLNSFFFLFLWVCGISQKEYSMCGMSQPSVKLSQQETTQPPYILSWINNSLLKSVCICTETNLPINNSQYQHVSFNLILSHHNWLSIRLNIYLALYRETEIYLSKAAYQYLSIYLVYILTQRRVTLLTLYVSLAVASKYLYLEKLQH